MDKNNLIHKKRCLEQDLENIEKKIEAVEVPEFEKEDDLLKRHIKEKTDLQKGHEENVHSLKGLVRRAIKQYREILGEDCRQLQFALEGVDSRASLSIEEKLRKKRSEQEEEYQAYLDRDKVRYAAIKRREELQAEWKGKRKELLTVEHDLKELEGGDNA